jgi:hypothetical protein
MKSNNIWRKPKKCIYQRAHAWDELSRKFVKTEDRHASYVFNENEIVRMLGWIGDEMGMIKDGGCISDCKEI